MITASATAAETRSSDLSSTSRAFTNRSYPLIHGGMPKPPTPPDLKHCGDCGKIIGPHRGWFGPECQ